MKDCMLKVIDIVHNEEHNGNLKLAVIWMTRSGSRFLETDTIEVKIEDLPFWQEVDFVG